MRERALGGHVAAGPPPGGSRPGESRRVRPRYVGARWALGAMVVSATATWLTTPVAGQATDAFEPLAQRVRALEDRAAACTRRSEGVLPRIREATQRAQELQSQTTATATAAAAAVTTLSTLLNQADGALAARWPSELRDTRIMLRLAHAYFANSRFQVVPGVLVTRGRAGAGCMLVEQPAGPRVGAVTGSESSLAEVFSSVFPGFSGLTLGRGDHDLQPAAGQPVAPMALHLSALVVRDADMLGNLQARLARLARPFDPRTVLRDVRLLGLPAQWGLSRHLSAKELVERCRDLAIGKKRYFSWTLPGLGPSQRPVPPWDAEWGDLTLVFELECLS